MYLAIIFLPLLSAIISGFFGRKIGVKGSQLISCFSMLITSIFVITAFIEISINNTPVLIELFKWIDSELLNVFWSFYFDSLTVSMLIPVVIISTLVHIYSVWYMSHDPHNQRFFSYLSLFTFKMIILITSNNFLLMFLGWEGVGVCSYLLVCFWFTRIAANQSSISAFLTNRVGDCFLTVGMFIILLTFGSIDYSTVFSLAPFINQNIITIIGICLLIGAMAKSSQIGLHIWLPLAMEGPTPVSALIHAATMVTAGVYLLIRTSPIIEYSSTVLLLALWIGTITTILSSLIGLFQQDIKKVIAYSTMSQLGIMVIAIGLSSYNVALFHLINHAFYKGLLFLGAGIVIHAFSDNQDLRKYGSLKLLLPYTYISMFLASLSLVAFPGMSGFYSKELIMESAFGQYSFSSFVVYILTNIGALFTCLYSIKIIYFTFLTYPKGIRIYPYLIAGKDFLDIERKIYSFIPLFILSFLSIFFGYISKDIFIGLGTNFFSDNSLFIHPSHEILLDTEFSTHSHWSLQILPLLISFVGSIIYIFIIETYPYFITINKYNYVYYNINILFSLRIFFELFYNKYIVNIILMLGGQMVKIVDKGFIELIGPFGLEKKLLEFSNNISNIETGVISSYALYILIGSSSFMLIPFYLHGYNDCIIVLLFSLIHVINKK